MLFRSVITISCPPQAVTASSQPQHPTATATTATATSTTMTTHGQHQTAKAAAVAVRDTTHLEPLVRFFYLFFFITLMFFLGLLNVSE